MHINESSEMYLETILVLEKENTAVHSVDIARKMHFSKPSVSVKVHALEKENYLSINEDGSILLLPKGREIAERIYERHNVIGEVLVALGVNPGTAYSDACKIEHDISEETFLCLKKHVAEYSTKSASL